MKVRAGLLCAVVAAAIVGGAAPAAAAAEECTYLPGPEDPLVSVCDFGGGRVGVTVRDVGAVDVEVAGSENAPGVQVFIDGVASITVYLGRFCVIVDPWGIPLLEPIEQCR